MKVETNFCRCHPESCCCDAYVVVHNGREVARCYDAEMATAFKKALEEVIREAESLHNRPA